MKMKKYGIIFISWILCLISSSSSAFYLTNLTGEKLLYYCTKVISHQEETYTTGNTYDIAQDYVEGGICIGYLAAIGDMESNYKTILSATDYTNKKLTHIFCIPDTADSQQLAKVVIKYLNEHPEKLNQQASWLVIEAFSKYFPCLNQSGGLT